MSDLNNVKFDLNEIQKNAEILDSEALHLYLISKVESGEYDSCLDALADYIEESDIDIENPVIMKKYISPSLRCILYNEAMQKSMLNVKKTSVDIDRFF